MSRAPSSSLLLFPFKKHKVQLQHFQLSSIPEDQELSFASAYGAKRQTTDRFDQKDKFNHKISSLNTTILPVQPTLMTLPTELQLNILKYLPAIQFFRCARINKYFQALVNSPDRRRSLHRLFLSSFKRDSSKNLKILGEANIKITPELCFKTTSDSEMSLVLGILSSPSGVRMTQKNQKIVTTLLDLYKNSFVEKEIKRILNEINKHTQKDTLESKLVASPELFKKFYSLKAQSKPITPENIQEVLDQLLLTSVSLQAARTP